MKLADRRKAPWAGDQPVARPLPTQDTINADIHASIGIRTQDPSVWAGENISCIALRGPVSGFLQILNY
jgi:hypothetical protein